MNFEGLQTKNIEFGTKNIELCLYGRRPGALPALAPPPKTSQHLLEIDIFVLNINIFVLKILSFKGLQTKNIEFLTKNMELCLYGRTPGALPALAPPPKTSQTSS